MSKGYKKKVVGTGKSFYKTHAIKQPKGISNLTQSVAMRRTELDLANDPVLELARRSAEMNLSKLGGVILFKAVENLDTPRTVKITIGSTTVTAKLRHELFAYSTHDLQRIDSLLIQFKDNPTDAVIKALSDMGVSLVLEDADPNKLQNLECMLRGE